MKRIVAFGIVGFLAAASAGATGHSVYVFIGGTGSAYPWYAPDGGIRCQMLFDRDKIDYAGTITEFELEKNLPSGTYGNVKFYLCHTPLSALTTDFVANYGGNTPKMVASFSTYKLPDVGGVYPIPMAETFDYNNRDNLVLEVTWETGARQKVLVLAGSLTAHLCAAYDHQATTGEVHNEGHNARIHFDAYPGVAAASFGRVRALFR
ncbi:MAG TPA: hypothetical protein VMW93_05250 [bacterium]|nr:hypothetical protein [bacterium]